MPETWYVLEDGSHADPNEVAPDRKGVLRHRDGRAVAMRTAAVPSTRSVDPEEERRKAKAAAPKPKANEAEPPKADRQMKAEPGKGTYRTR